MGKNDDHMSKNPYKNFNKAFKVFIRDLMRSYPDQSEFKLMHTGYKLLKTVNKKLPNQLFKSTFDSYYENIRRKDDSFFMSHEFSIPDDFGMIYRAMVPVFINMWKGADANTREAVWQHMNHLYDLSIKCKESEH
jgi:hypothetical protein